MVGCEAYRLTENEKNQITEALPLDSKILKQSENWYETDWSKHNSDIWNPYLLSDDYIIKSLHPTKKLALFGGRVLSLGTTNETS